MPDQDTNTTPIQETTQPFNLGKWLRIALIVVPIIVVVVILVLALLGPTPGTIFSNIVDYI